MRAASDSHELRFLPLAPVDYSLDQSYTVKLDCRDSSNLVLLQISVLVRIEPNTPPFFPKPAGQCFMEFNVLFLSGLTSISVCSCASSPTRRPTSPNLPVSFFFDSFGA